MELYEYNQYKVTCMKWLKLQKAIAGTIADAQSDRTTRFVHAHTDIRTCYEKHKFGGNE